MPEKLPAQPSTTRLIARVLAWLAGLVFIAAVWLARQIGESAFGEMLKQTMQRAGPTAEGLCMLACGLGLALVGPWMMVRENRLWTFAEKTRRYGIVEVAIVMVAGIVFTLVGAAFLLGYVTP